MKKITRIVAVEDDRSYLGLLRQLFGHLDQYEWVGDYRNPVTFLAALPDLEFDVVLLDINLPKLSGLDCIADIRAAHPGCRIVILSVHDDDDYVLKAFVAGADGYLLKDSTPDQILEAIEDAIKGGAPMSAAVARKVIGILGKMKQEQSDARQQSSDEVLRLLSPREAEILQLLATGKRSGEVAEQLFISLDTVKTHISHIYEKLRVRNRSEAVAKFLGGT